MVNVTFITVGTLKEDYWRQAMAEYGKRLSAYGRFSTVELRESRLPSEPSSAEIHAALDAEADKILAAIPPRTFRVALCVEGQGVSSEKLAQKLELACQTHSGLCFIIGSSYGLSEKVKAACDWRLSVSDLTFPHQLMRVILAEAVYRSFSIQKGAKYHK